MKNSCFGGNLDQSSRFSGCAADCIRTHRNVIAAKQKKTAKCTSRDEKTSSRKLVKHQGWEENSHLVAAVEDASQGVVPCLARLGIDSHHHSTFLKAGQVTFSHTVVVECRLAAISTIIVCWVFLKHRLAFYEASGANGPFCPPALKLLGSLPSPSAPQILTSEIVLQIFIER